MSTLRSSDECNGSANSRCLNSRGSVTFFVFCNGGQMVVVTRALILMSSFLDSRLNVTTS